VISVNFDKMDKETKIVIDYLFSNNLTLTENIAVIAKVLLVLLKIQETYMFTDEAKNTIKQTSEKITNAIIRLYNKVGVRLNNLN
jgi:hypothetical protein